MTSPTPSPLAPISNAVETVRVLIESGILRPMRPDRLVGMVSALRTWGLTLAGGADGAAALHPDKTAIVDERGTLSFAELQARTTALAEGLAAEGISPGDNVGVLCRNHRGIVEATVALSKLGANALYLNTSFAGPQVAEVSRREGATAVIYDAEFEPVMGSIGDVARFVAWTGGEAVDHPSLDDLIGSHDHTPIEPPDKPGRQVILTSGTTGTPKGATRSNPASADPIVAILSRIPLRAGETTFLAAPMFHAWGFAHMSLGLLLSSTMVMRRTFDPEETLAAIAQHRASTLIAVPVMLQRIMALPGDVRRRYDTSSLRVVALSGSALSGDLAKRFMDEFGDVIYNLYGSTEVAWASIATPEDLRAAPGTAGRAPRGTILRILDEQGHEVPAGETGRIFVGNEMLFEGYTGGAGSKEVIDGLMSTGDVGHLDREGRLFIEGRDDDMIVSGGENVFPQEVEELIGGHEAVADCAVVGVDDETYGQRLKAFVVLRPGASLSEEQIKDFVKQHLARFKVPREVVFLDELPRNPAGKILKRELKEG
ncbi:MAG: hypothetical protein QOG64_1561 [Acidimicrobiaceae bacterium]|nr:hypothetical protein [Acidimicrobiaceae bacterium]